jgi:hypothetical protein
MRRTSDVLAQLEHAGLDLYILQTDHSEEGALKGRMSVRVLNLLDADPRFASGKLYQLHREVGNDLTEYRAHPGELGEGSLQIVIDKKTGNFHADIDKYNPYSDVVNIFGHSFGEVLPNWVKKIFRRRKK